MSTLAGAAAASEAGRAAMTSAAATVRQLRYCFVLDNVPLPLRHCCAIARPQLRYLRFDRSQEVLIDFTMKSKETGREAAMQIFHYWHFRDGKVDHYRGTEDTAATVEMLGK
jgi:hypothetical protein